MLQQNPDCCKSSEEWPGFRGGDQSFLAYLVNASAQGEHLFSSSAPSVPSRRITSGHTGGCRCRLLGGLRLLFSSIDMCSCLLQRSAWHFPSLYRLMEQLEDRNLFRTAHPSGLRLNPAAKALQSRKYHGCQEHQGRQRCCVS